MAVPIRVVTLAEDSPVILVRKRRIVIAVRGGKLDFARHIDHRLTTGERASPPDTLVLSTRFCAARNPNPRPAMRRITVKHPPDSITRDRARNESSAQAA